MNFQNRLRHIRNAYKLTQADVAYRANISPQAYGKIERNVPNATVKTLLKISAAIGITLPFLLDTNSERLVEKENNL